MNYVISGLPLAAFQKYFDLDSAALLLRGIERRIADSKPGYPCRISLQDAEIGECLLLLNYQHHDVAGPYRASGPIFVREGAITTACVRNAIPDQQRSRLLSVRAYDQQGGMRSAEVIEGEALEALIYRYFADQPIAYLHVHNAKQGCFACRVDRD